jgi:hypothetical protein
LEILILENTGVSIVKYRPAWNLNDRQLTPNRMCYKRDLEYAPDVFLCLKFDGQTSGLKYPSTLLW